MAKVLLVIAGAWLLLTFVKYHERIRSAGELPKNATERDRALAEQTTWWGQPLDPREFWKGRTVWLTTEVKAAANRHGRQYPPIPFGDQKFSSLSEKDIAKRWGVAEGESTVYHYSEREVAYWSDFERTHPLPPEELERKQMDIEGSILASRNWKGITQNEIAIFQGGSKEAAIRDGYPPEAFTDDALYWSYVVNKHREYENNVQTEPGPIASALAHNDAISFDLITNSLNADQVKKANSWKVAYLKRLKSQNVDQSYIDAYMQAWNLSSNDVFGSGS